jgi:hypothetical protein
MPPWCSLNASLHQKPGRKLRIMFAVDIEGRHIIHGKGNQVAAEYEQA